MRSFLFVLSLFVAFSSFAQGYTNVKITGYDLLKYPTHRPDQSQWDWDIYPDVMLYVVTDHDGTAPFYSSDRVRQLQKPVSGIQFLRPCKVENLNVLYTFALFDYDDNGAHELMSNLGQVDFSALKTYPKYYDLEVNDAKIRLYLSWY